MVAKKGQFKRLDKCVYFEVDSILPEREEFEFLRNKNFRIKTMKLRKQLSQGIVFPLSILPEGTTTETDRNVTDILGVKKFEPVIPACLGGVARGLFPTQVPKTDEMRIQSVPEVLQELEGQPYYVAVKIDGSSGTFANIDGDIQVCSRNLSLKETEDNTFWKMFHRYDLKNVLEIEGNIAIQGEVAGPGIQKNPLGLKDHDLFVFDVYRIDTGDRLDYTDLVSFCERHNLNMVPVEVAGDSFSGTLTQMLELARGHYPNGKRREGIVIRPQVGMYSPALSSRLSFKVINNDFLLKDEG